MIIGILCGQNKISQKKAFEYYQAIKEVGHDAIIFIRQKFDFDLPHIICESKELMFESALQSNAEFFMTCTDNLGDIVSKLNQLRNKPFVPEGASLKTNLSKLSHNLDIIKTWENLDEVPNDIPLFVKPNNGSGGVSNGVETGDPWSYKMFASRDSFIKFLEPYGGIKRFNYAQENFGWMGKYIFQEHIEHTYVITRQYLNDGVPISYARLDLPLNYKLQPYKWIINFEDDFDFAKNTVWGTMTGMQALPTNSKPKINDYNLRCAALIPIFFKEVCPYFYITFFNNLLNNKRDAYNWKSLDFSIIPPKACPNFNNIKYLPSFEFYGEDEKYFGLVFND